MLHGTPAASAMGTGGRKGWYRIALLAQLKCWFDSLPLGRKQLQRASGDGWDMYKSSSEPSLRLLHAKTQSPASSILHDSQAEANPEFCQDYHRDLAEAESEQVVLPYIRCKAFAKARTCKLEAGLKDEARLFIFLDSGVVFLPLEAAAAWSWSWPKLTQVAVTSLRPVSEPSRKIFDARLAR